jgi:hypothetical protein
MVDLTSNFTSKHSSFKARVRQGFPAARLRRTHALVDSENLSSGITGEGSRIIAQESLARTFLRDCYDYKTPVSDVYSTAVALLALRPFPIL